MKKKNLYESWKHIVVICRSKRLNKASVVEILIFVVSAFQVLTSKNTTM